MRRAGTAIATPYLRDIWVKNLILVILLFTTACMQSRKGIKGTEEAWVWGAVDMCDTYPDCENSSTYMVGKLHFDSNMTVFKIEKLPADFDYYQLASDETITYRILAKRDGEGSWRRMNWISSYEDRRLGLTENMELSVGDIVRVKPPVGYIEQYNRWILERVVTKAGKAQAYGTGERLLDIQVQYAELQDK